eukprot:766975-Rhodomonas_salina.1
MTGNYYQDPATNRWTVWVPTDKADNLSRALEEQNKSSHNNLTTLTAGHWNLHHQNAQHGKYLQVQGVLAATDGSVN